MRYRLKAGQESFHVVDGPFAGRGFVQGKTYAEVPPGEGWRFEAVGAVDTDILAAAKQAVEDGDTIGSGAPKVEAMEKILGRDVTAAERDAAWRQI